MFVGGASKSSKVMNFAAAVASAAFAKDTLQCFGVKKMSLLWSIFFVVRKISWNEFESFFSTFNRDIFSFLVFCLVISAKN